MDKAINTIEEWLNECKSDNKIENLLESIENDQEHLIHAICLLCEEKTRYNDMYENVIKQAFILAKSKEEKLREFILLFTPSLIYIYLSAISMGDKKSVGSLECTLLALYNKEVLDDYGIPRVASFRLPTLARQSIFHDPASLSHASYTPDSLQRLELGDTETVRWGPPKHIDSISAATRNHLVTALFVAFNSRLSKLPKIALMYLCKASSKLVCQGYNRPGHHHRASYGSDSSFGVYPRPIPRIPVTSDLLVELVHAIYFSMFNDFASLGIQALEDIHMRAQYELFADVLLMTNSIKNSLKVNPSGQLIDGPMGISVALPPSLSSAPLSKSYITNASFRTKKLPDDIPIQRLEGGQEGGGSKGGLKAISEEHDGGEEGGRGARHIMASGREKLKLPANIPLPNMVKKRDKNKNGTTDKKVDRKSKDNRNSLPTSDSEGLICVPGGESQTLEMKPLTKTSPMEAQKGGSSAIDADSNLGDFKPSVELNGGDANHIGAKLL